MLFACVFVHFAAAAYADDKDKGHENAEAAASEASANPRLLGVLPNVTTVDRGVRAAPMTSGQMFRATALGTFDPVVFPYVGLMTEIERTSSLSFERHYATALADNTLGNFMTSAVMPSLLHQDPRYYRRAEGSIAARAAYALSRSAITRSMSGTSQFNVSEFAGNFIAAGMSNQYYPAANRSATDTLTRYASQMLMDALANEMKEFWPDVRARLHHN